ncbi:MAG: hypothetical protein ABSF90_21005 [Syntrophobacteraceae bacterium]|jgi:hypothetical protein
MIVNPPTPAQIAWVFEKLLRHRRRGGSLRALVAKGFGLETDRWAYPILQDAGGAELCDILNAARKNCWGKTQSES